MSSASTFKYQQLHDQAAREKECNKIKTNKKYDHTVPVIVEPGAGCRLQIEKSKYLVPEDLALCQFVYAVRKRIIGSLTPEQALFFFVHCKDSTSIPTLSSTMAELHKEFQEPDGFLYLSFMIESTFGGAN